ncbi:MAG: 50S ribosomal protein L11 methyltransferase [Oscillospiraceae bacterium]|nr:50S ribosomal protein L11 methyltransferase [Oscillospiraceae bacterium]
MNWLEVTVKSESNKIDVLCGRLEMMGIDGLSIEDEKDFGVFLENNHEYWDYVDEELEQRFKGLAQIKFYLEDNEQGEEKLAEVKEKLTEEILVKKVADSDWENNWQQYYKPMEIGEKLLVIPEWEECEVPGRTPLRLDPGLIFGTGSHPTTRMCLEALEKYAGKGKRVLDIGCGSGILAIGTLVLGCDRAIGCDIDPKAPDVAEANAALNGIGTDRFKVYAGDVLSDAGMRKFLGKGYDIVLANIVSDVIIPLSGFVRGFMNEGARFICSGIIEGRQDEVEAALLKNGFEILAHYHIDDWHAFECR